MPELQSASRELARRTMLRCYRHISGRARRDPRDLPPISAGVVLARYAHGYSRRRPVERAVWWNTRIGVSLMRFHRGVGNGL